MGTIRRVRISSAMLVVAGVVAAVLSFGASNAVAQLDSPYEDTGFAPVTPLPDADQIIVRERYYGAEGIDLTDFGIGEGPVDFVQSIYFRFFVDAGSSEFVYFTGLAVFPDEVEILGFVTSGSQLGGENDDGDWTATDLIFGIGDDPDLYSESARGFEASGNEFIGQISPNSFVFGLSVTTGVDDFRVIIDYGDQWSAETSFDVYSFDFGGLGENVPAVGYRIGDDVNPAVFGSGDYGEINALLNIPLTSTTLPLPSDALLFEPESSVFFLRDTSGVTYVDGYDTHGDIPAPNLFELVDGITSPAGITEGQDGNLYCVGLGGGFDVINILAGLVSHYNLDNLSGDNVGITDLVGNDLLFVIRDTSGQTQIDLVDRELHDIVGGYPLPDGPTSPCGIAGAADGRLYALGTGGGLTGFDPDGGSMENRTLEPPGGDYVDLTSHADRDRLYLLRDTSGDTYLDVVDLQDQSVGYGFSAFPQPTSPVGVTDGPNGYLYVIGAGSSGPAAYTVVDPDDGTVLFTHAFMDFTGANKAITNFSFEPNVSAVPPPAGARTTGFWHLAVPNPFNARAQIVYELQRPERVRIAVYDLRGELMCWLCDEEQSAGWQGVHWDGRDEAGRALPSGTYLYRIEAGLHSERGKIVLAK